MPLHSSESRVSIKMFSGLVITQIALLLLATSLVSASTGWHPNALRVPPNTIEIVRSRGFLCELYSIQSNGYYLTLYHIINPLANPKTLNKYPVLYGHGILYDSMSMISRSENSRPRKPTLGEPTISYGSLLDGSNDYSLPFMFSNNNFDVWLFDAKGTNSLNTNISAKINPATANQFWDFTLDDEALIDLPLLIDFVLTKTASTKLVYVGYSETTFFMFALLSTAPEYADKISAYIAMAPVTYLSHCRGITIPALAPLAALTPEFLHSSLLPQPVIETLDSSMRFMCSDQGLSNLICGSIVNGIGGKGVGEMTPNFFAEFFKSTSLKAVKQMIQLYAGKRFGMYDYGVLDNMKRYGQPNPPAYDLGRVKSDRIILVRGLKDFISTPEDQAQLIRELGTRPHLDIVIPPYNHFDFIDGKDLIRLANAPIMMTVYELMYRDGPNILRDPAQVQAISIAANIRSGAKIPTVSIGPTSANPGAEMAISRLLMNREPSDLLKNSANIIKTLAGAKNIIQDLRFFVGR